MIFTSNENLSPEDKQKYIDYIQAKYSGQDIISIDVEFDGEYANIRTNTTTSIPFERIRRITGYLTGDMKSWNTAKAAEERARVKHL